MLVPLAKDQSGKTVVTSRVDHPTTALLLAQSRYAVAVAGPDARRSICPHQLLLLKLGAERFALAFAGQAFAEPLQLLGQFAPTHGPRHTSGPQHDGPAVDVQGTFADDLDVVAKPEARQHAANLGGAVAGGLGAPAHELAGEDELAGIQPIF